MGWYQTCAFRNFDNYKYLSIAEDGLRCGSPPEETHIFLSRSFDLQLGVVGIPQATDN